VRTLRGSRWQMFTKIQLPGALPYIFAGMKVAAILAVAGAIVGEFLGSDKGLGYLMLQVQVTLDTPAMFMAVILITLLGMVLYGLVLALERLLVVKTRGSSEHDGGTVHPSAGVTKVYRTGRRNTWPSRTRPSTSCRRTGVAGRPVGLRQVDAAEDPRRAAPARRRHRAHRLGHAPVRPGARYRHGVPGAAAAEVAAHPRQRAAAGRDPRLPMAREPRARARSAGAGRPGRLRGQVSPTSSPAACSSARRSRAR
jgi:hypothetical protein